MKDFVASRRIDYIYIASSLNKFILLNLSIAVNLFICKKLLCSLSKDKNVSHGSFYKDEWFLDSGTSTYLTLFEFDFIDINPDNYGWVETVNLKVLLLLLVLSWLNMKYLILKKRLLRLLCQNYS